MNDADRTNETLAQIQREIEAATDAHDLARLQRMQATYLDVVHTGRQMDVYELSDFVIHHLRQEDDTTADPFTGECLKRNMDQYPSLMEICSGKPELAAGYVVALMEWADGDDITFGIRRALQECEMAFARYIENNAR